MLLLSIPFSSLVPSIRCIPVPLPCIIALKRMVDVIPGSVVTLKMEVDENLNGSAGCNKYFEAYNDLTCASFAMAGPIDLTRMYCGQQDDTMDQERSY
jgi:heat shock protein HslJ